MTLFPISGREVALGESTPADPFGEPVLSANAVPFPSIKPATVFVVRGFSLFLLLFGPVFGQRSEGVEARGEYRQIDFAAEKTSMIQITVDSRQETARIWSAAAEAESATGQRERFDLVSILTPDSLLWWSLVYRRDGTAANALADFSSNYRCVGDGRSVRCFLTLVFKEVLVRTCNDQVPTAQRHQYLADRVAELANPGGWSLMDSFQRIPIADVAGLKTLFQRQIGGPVRAIRIQDVKKTTAGYELGSAGKTAAPVSWC
jgi:hypothetical protein